jgi:uncharacterized protein with PIN domain
LIVYLDTSSVVKLYKDEEHSVDVEHLIATSDAVVTSRITYTECRAAFALARRLANLRQANLISRTRLSSVDIDSAYNVMVSSFIRDWDLGNFAIKAVDQRTVKLAGDLAERYVLRAYDSVHVASAVILARGVDVDIWFSSFDPVQASAAQAEGLSLAHEVN